ncbi:MAG: hypothetical protein NC394_03240 [Bacteroides sp.]|nr:hypothetical protein [Bacteroides sp.]
MKAYGGYLPLELRHDREYYCNNERMKVKAMNSGKAAIYYAIKCSNAKKIYIPHYICPSVVDVARKTGIVIERYYIDESLLPLNLESQNEDSAVLLVNYYGIVYNKIKAESEKHSKVIMDNTQAFFAEPILRKGVYNVYSCKKFIGVPDGGYLIADTLEDFLFEQDYSSKHMDFCIQSLEYGTEHTYEQKKENDLRFLTEIRQMSYMTQRLLQNVDYNYVIEKRKENFQKLHEKLKKYNRMQFDGDEFVPYYYPFFGERNMQKELISKKIYAPVLWKELITEKFDNKAEKEFSEKISFIPCDQRYDENDMNIISERVLEIIRKSEKI